MDIRLKEDFLSRWKKYFGGAELPITCWYTDDERVADRAEPAKGHRCFIADLAKIRKGESLRFDIAAIGCGGGKRYLGFTKDVIPNFEHFFSSGIPGILEGGRYKNSPELVNEYETRSPSFTAPARHIVFKRWDRPFVPETTLSFAIPMKKFAAMINNMDESFLITKSWEAVQRRMGEGITTQVATRIESLPR